MKISTNYTTTNTNTKTSTTSSNNNFSKLLENITQTEEEKRKELIEDLLSVLRTGFTKNELETLQEYLRQIKKLKDSQEENGLSDKEINDLISALELAIYKLKSKNSGTAIINADDKNKKQTNEIMDFDQRLEDIQTSLNDMKNAKEKLKKFTTSSQAEQLELLHKHKDS